MSKNVMTLSWCDIEALEVEMVDYTFLTMPIVPYGHAGWIETSYMLEVMPELVKPHYRDQPDIQITDKEMILPEVVMAKTKNYGHLGFPKEATAKLGNALNHDMIEYINKCVTAFINRTDYKQYEHHELFELPFMKVKNGGRSNV